MFNLSYGIVQLNARYEPIAARRPCGISLAILAADPAISNFSNMTRDLEQIGLCQ
jgi:hypothetical protein